MQDVKNSKELRVLACDFDGTLATEGRIEFSTMAALSTVEAQGGTLLLVTGRILPELNKLLDERQQSLFRFIIAENGGVAYQPETKEVTLLTTPLPDGLLAEVRNFKARPLTIGRVLVSLRREHDVPLKRLAERHGFSAELIYNKSDVMLLPGGVNKAFGLRAVSRMLGIELSSILGMGDAENDIDFLRACGLGVAVENALPELKAEADMITEGAAGKGVEEIIAKYWDGTAFRI